MKETVNVSIASQAFTVDNDAWRQLDAYLRNIRGRIDPGDSETLADIEARIADILREKLPSPMMVVTLSMVKDVMNQIGSPNIFGPSRGGESGDSGDARSAGPLFGRGRSLRRSSSDRVLAGICGGIAECFELDAATVRLVMLLLILFGGLSVWLYVILWIVIPSDAKN